MPAQVRKGTLGDIDPDEETGTLTVTLDPLPTARASQVAPELCDHLNYTQTVYPGTKLALRFLVKEPNTMHK